MQNRYVADIGDYVKLAILRQLAAGKRVGVAWWLVPDESHNGDGGNRQYLKRPDEWKRFDPDLFEALLKIDKEKDLDVRALEDPASFQMPFSRGIGFLAKHAPFQSARKSGGSGCGA